MPPKDPEKNRAHAKEGMRKLRAERRLSRLQGRPDKPPLSAIKGAIGSPSTPLDFSPVAIAERKIQAGQKMIELGEKMLAAEDPAGTKLLTQGFEMVDANAPILARAARADEDDRLPLGIYKEFLTDSTYAQLAEDMVRIMEEMVVRANELEMARRERVSADSPDAPKLKHMTPRPLFSLETPGGLN